MIKTGLLAAALSLAAPITAMAEESSSPLPGTLTGNVAITNDYVFRGFSQTNSNAAVSGGLDWDSGVGFHVGTWLSSVNFNDLNSATTEVDLYAGYGGKIENFSYDAGFTFYWYPGSRGNLNYNFWEVYGKAGYDFGITAVTLGVAYTPDNFGATGDATYLSSLFTVPVVDMFSISAGVNYYMLTKGLKNYLDYNIGATLKVYDWFDVDARFYNTDIQSCGSGSVCDSRFVVAIKRTF